MEDINNTITAIYMEVNLYYNSIGAIILLLWEIVSVNFVLGSVARIYNNLKSL